MDDQLKLTETAYENGYTDATKDIEAGTLRLFWGTRGSWGHFFEELFKNRFGVKVESTSCIVWSELQAYRKGYNETVRAYIEQTYGSEAYEKALEEVEQFRLESYKRYLNHRDDI